MKIYQINNDNNLIDGIFINDDSFGFFFFTKNKINTSLKKCSFKINDKNITLIDGSDFIIKHINNTTIFMGNNICLDVECYKLDELDDNSMYIAQEILDFLSNIVHLPNGNYVVGNVRDYISVIEKMNDLYPNLEHFYRGHYYYKYLLVPSLYREKKYYDNEDFIYMDFKSEFYNELAKKTYIEILTTMQHYKMPTRLLDTTSNPLVALFMACDKPLNYTNKKVNVGEVIYMSCDRKDIKYSDSNTTTLLSSLACLETKYKKELYYLIKKGKEENNPDIYLNSISYKRFVAEVKTELVSFDEKIFDPGVLLHHFHVKVGMINDRIIAQSGNFVLFGLFDYDKSEIFPLETKSKERIFIVHRDFIMKELEMLNIDNGTMYPDKDHMSYEIVKKYK